MHYTRALVNILWLCVLKADRTVSLPVAQGDLRIELLGRTGEIAKVQKNYAHEIAYKNLQTPELQPFYNSPHKDNAKQEHEGIPSQIFSKYDNIQKKTVDYFNPKPIVDTIKEEDKYGNNGDKFYASKLVVQGFEVFSNLLNKLVDAPLVVFQAISKTVGDKLNDVGGKIVGL